MYNNKFIAIDTLLIGIKTFKECYREREKELSPVLVDVACHALNMFEDYMKRLPLIDASEVAHGRWIDNYTNIVCSVCNAEYSDEIVFMNRNFEFEDLKYCPNCGALMDGEKDGN